jgi:hypothetical protein
MTQASRLLAAFEGSSNAYGETTVGSIGKNGKAEAKSFVKRGQMTEAMVQAHIDGRQGIGSIPIDGNNECSFGALDIDTYDLDLVELNQRVRSLNMPFLTCRSKSGGAHLFVFLQDKVPAKLLREYLSEAAIVLGFAGCEIFPKQDELLHERGDLGNFINMPYHNAEFTTRYCLDENGEGMSLDQFLDAVDAARCHLSKFEAVKAPEDRGYPDWLPPCMKNMMRFGPISTDRNKSLFMAGFWAKTKVQEDWEDALEELNRTIFATPLPAKEVVSVQGSVAKKDYGPPCKQEPFASYCDRAACELGRNPDDVAKVGGLTVIQSEPPYYFMDVNGKRVELTVDALQNQTQFHRACIAQINFYPLSMKAPEWTSLINGLLREAIYVEVPKELTIRGQFEEVLRQYCTGSAQAREAAELLTNKPWLDRGRYKFRMDGLIQFMKNRQFTEYSHRAKIQDELKRLNGGAECNGPQKYKNSHGEWKNVRVWWVPEEAVKADDIDLEVTKLEDDIPF